MSKQQEIQEQAEGMLDDIDSRINHLDDGMIKVTFDEPLVFGEKSLKSTVLRKAKAKDLKGVGSLEKIEDPDTVMLLAGRLSDNIESTEMAGELSWCDLMTIMRVLTDFLLPSQKTGKTA